MPPTNPTHTHVIGQRIRRGKKLHTYQDCTEYVVKDVCMSWPRLWDCCESMLCVCVEGRFGICICIVLQIKLHMCAGSSLFRHCMTFRACACVWAGVWKELRNNVMFNGCQNHCLAYTHAHRHTHTVIHDGLMCANIRMREICACACVFNKVASIPRFYAGGCMRVCVCLRMAVYLHCPGILKYIKIVQFKPHIYLLLLPFTIMTMQGKSNPTSAFNLDPV